jgi:hypothetical protein
MGQRKSGEIAYRLLADVPASRPRRSPPAPRNQNAHRPVRVNVRFPAPMQKELLA